MPENRINVESANGKTASPASKNPRKSMEATNVMTPTEKTGFQTFLGTLLMMRWSSVLSLNFNTLT